MTEPKSIQIHYFMPLNGAAPNQGDDHHPKSIVFGDTPRNRFSSQSAKKKWAHHDGTYSLYTIPGVEKDIRSRDIISRMVVPHIKAEGQYIPEVLTALEDSMNIGLYGSEKADNQKNRQCLLLGMPEINFLVLRATEICQENPEDPGAVVDSVNAMFNKERKNFIAMKEATVLEQGLRTALFGRMVTSYPMANIDAAVHVAHAITIHPMETEIEYFSTIDDLRVEDQAPGAGYLGNSDINCSLYYGYVVVDIPCLVQNVQAVHRKDWLNAPRDLASELVHNLIGIIATVSPAARKGSTAAHAYASFMMVEIGEHQPRSLVDAFRQPVDSAQTEDGLRALSGHLEGLDRCYGQNEKRRFFSVNRYPIPGAEESDLPGIMAWARESVLQGKV